jgi:hypothetical protein
MQSYSRQSVIEVLNRLGHRELADEVLRDLPDPVDINQLEEWCVQHSLPVPTDELISRMGGSP